MKRIQPKITRRVIDQTRTEDLDSNPLLARLFAARGVSDRAALDLRLASLCRPDSLGGLDGAVELLVRALREQWKICVVGDYDADGATSSALAIRVLRACGANEPTYFVPDRFRFGYGLGPAVVEALHDQQPDLLITVDNGISSVEGVHAAREQGMEVLVTDHHLPPEVLPAASAIVNPNLPGDGFPSKHLAGVGVVFYLMSALRATLARIGWFDERGLESPNLASYLDLVALGTVADVVPLDRNNRILVEQGLRRVRGGAGSYGVTALLRVAGRNPAAATSSDFGFAAGPRLNAAGRLEDMSLGIACLLSDSEQEAMAYAEKLDNLNRERREIEAQMRSEAEAHLATWLDEHRVGELPPGICLFDANWHEGVIGILAGRVRESVHRPTIVFTRDSGTRAKGSARSVPGINVRDAIADVERRLPGTVLKFGGHAMAAGLTLESENLQRFGDCFADVVREQQGDQPFAAEVLSDGELPQECFTLSCARELRYAAPWGNQFPEPVFDGVFTRVQQRVVGEKHLKLSLCPVMSPGANPIDAIAFNETGEGLGEGDVRVAYKLDVNEFRGEQKLQLIIEHIEDAYE